MELNEKVKQMLGEEQVAEYVALDMEWKKQDGMYQLVDQAYEDQNKELLEVIDKATNELLQNIRDQRENKKRRYSYWSARPVQIESETFDKLIEYQKYLGIKVERELFLNKNYLKGK